MLINLVESVHFSKICFLASMHQPKKKKKKSQTIKEGTNKAACLIIKFSDTYYLEGRTAWGTKGLYAVSRSAASR
jgi:hypothetical protein